LLGETLDPRVGSEATAQVAAAVKGRSSDPDRSQRAGSHTDRRQVITSGGLASCRASLGFRIRKRPA